MATLTGGGTIATVGLTERDNTVVTNVLQSTFTAVTNPTKIEVLPTTSETTTTSAPVLVGTFEASSVQNRSFSSTSDLSLVSIGTGNNANNKQITNLVVDDNTKGVILTDTGANTVVGFIGGTNTSLVVGDAGTQFVDLSRSTQNATIVSGTGNDSVLGGSGNDQVRLGDFGVANGGTGADTLIGGTGTATLGGGGGADSIVAAAGGGALIGELGNDTMVGGAGKDVFIYTSGGGNDVINGFDPASDTLGLANFQDISAAGLSLIDIINRATVSGGNTIITMPDGSTITVAGATGINVNWFTIK